MRGFELRVLLCASLAASLAAQAPRFEVASIHRSASGNNLVHYQPGPGGRFNAENITVRFLLQMAYEVNDYQVIGAPAWTNTERYDVAARGDAGQPTRPMIQSLLAERFKLALHTQKRELPVYRLLVAKGGPKLPASKAGACVPWSPESPVVIVPGQKQPHFCGFRGFGYEGTDRKLDMDGVTLADLATALSRELHQTVVDATGLAGRFDVHLRWTPVLPASPDAGGPSLFTALPEQLGLKFDAGKGSVQVLVIDNIDRPTAN
jgi:uncharacterized protein (TIGR03435 family)